MQGLRERLNKVRDKAERETAYRKDRQQRWREIDIIEREREREDGE